MTPDFATNAPRGYMGDPKRGAALGRPYIGSDARPLAELESCFVHACERLSGSLRLRDMRVPDAFKPSAWQAAADYWREERERFRAAIKAAEARAKAPGAPKITLRRIRLNSGGYDSNGTYWGIDEPLYWAADESGEYDATFRARGRANAKTIVRETYPNATFYN